MSRKIVQWLTLILSNAHLQGFINGRIYRGPSKLVCVPGLNCYSCPGALFSCPIGSLQAVIGSLRYKLSYYVVGMLLLFGAVFGRLVCGFLCPFGLIQELLHKIPGRKLKSSWRWPKYLKYAVLLVFVLAMPLLVTNSGVGAPAFCEYICPAGTLEAGLPLLALNPQLRQAVGPLFFWKLGVLIACLAGCVLIYRFFCKYLCPLGAIYALANRFSLYQLRLDEARCTRCGACRAVCKMDVDPVKDPRDLECIRCGDCTRACPHDALNCQWRQEGVSRERTA